MVDTANHASFRFITDCKPLTHHCELNSQVGWPALATYRLTHWYTFVYKAVLALLPLYLSNFILQRSTRKYSLHSQDFLMLSVLNTQTKTRNRAFKYSVPSAQNQLQNNLNLRELYGGLEWFLNLK